MYYCIVLIYHYYQGIYCIAGSFSVWFFYDKKIYISGVRSKGPAKLYRKSLCLSIYNLAHRRYSASTVRMY